MTAGDSELEDINVIKAMLKGVGSNLEMLIDRDFKMDNIRSERVNERPFGADGIHISFRFGFSTGAGVGQGSVLVPLPDALSLAAYLMCVPDAGVTTHRASREPDDGMKDALLEVGNMAGGALDDTVRTLCGSTSKVKFLGCQGVRSDVRPAFKYTEGDELVVGRAMAQIHDFPEFELIVMFPELIPMESGASAA